MSHNMLCHTALYNRLAYIVKATINNVNVSTLTLDNFCLYNYLFQGFLVQSITQQQQSVWSCGFCTRLMLLLTSCLQVALHNILRVGKLKSDMTSFPPGLFKTSWCLKVKQHRLSAFSHSMFEYRGFFVITGGE